MRTKAFTLVLFILVSLLAKAQVGREFWFVAPEVIHAHGDEPIFFRITTFDQPTKVTISSPANPSFNTLTVNIPANTQYTTPEDAFNINHIENRPSNAINNKGILITAADADISVYYEVANSANPDKFTLKGNNALGLEFFVPSQNVYQNQSKGFDPDPSEKTDIVATEDNTEVIIVPTVDVVGCNAGDTIRITLNRGQTFCVENMNPYYKSSMAGSYIKASKSIAVTISDDSVNERLDFRGAYDLIGDQLIPTNIIGSDYIIVNTSTDGLPGVNGSTVNKVFVLATEDNTIIKINGDDSFTRVLRKGEQVNIDITNNNMYIQATKPVYVYQLASLHYGNGNELGSSLLPHINCTGSDVVSFKRIFTDSFFLQLLVQGKDRNSFSIENHEGVAQNYLNNIKWKEVKGTNQGNTDNAWYTANINLSSQINTTNPYFVKNSSGLFHLSILEENGLSASYGYFSSFSNLVVNGLTESCKGNKIKLTTDEPMNSYEWFSDQTGDTPLSTSRDLYVDKSGKYWVTSIMEKGGCVLTDTIDVVFIQPEIALGPDTVVCPGTVLSFEGADTNLTYAWSNGTTGAETSISVTENYSGELSVLVTDVDGCSNEDTVLIEAEVVPEISLDKLEVCKGETVTVTNLAVFSKYEWIYNGNVLNIDPTQNYVKPQQSGLYQLTCWTTHGCEVSESFQVIVNDPVVVELDDVTTCSGEVVRVDGPVNNLYTYLWSDGSTNSYTNLSSEGAFWLEVKDDNGCIGRGEANLSYTIPLPIDLGPDRNECDDALLTVENHEDYSQFKWTFHKGTTETTINGNPTEHQYLVVNTGGSTEGQYKIEARDENGCVTKDSVNVSFIQVVQPQLSVDQNLCVGETVTITASNGYSNYKWFLGNAPLSQFDDMRSIQVDQPGEYTLEVNYLKCTTSNSIKIRQYGLPTVKLPDDMSFCPGQEAVLTVSNVEQSADGGSFDYLYWGTNNNVRFTDWSVASHTVNHPGTYTVTVVDEYGCKATDEIVVSEYSLQPINLGGPLSACADAGVTLQSNVTGTQSYEWYRLISGSEYSMAVNTDYLAEQSGTYRLAIIDANGCENSADVDVTINPLPEFTLTDAIVCPGNTHRFDGPSVAGYQFIWSDGSSNSYLETSVIGEYSLEVRDANGCSATETVSLSNYAPIPINLGPDREECAGIDLNINASSTHSNYSWELDNNPLAQPLQEHIYQIVNAQVVNSGTYKAIAEDSNGCAVEDEVVIEFIAAADLELVQTENLCKGESIDIVASDRYDTYKWSYEGAHLTQFDDDMFININQAGRYTVEASVAGCKKTNHIDVAMNELPSVQLPSDYSICPGIETTISSVQFTSSTNGNAFDYLYWGNNENIRNADWQNASLTVNSSGSYSITVVDEAGCKATDQIDISEYVVTPPELNGPYTACSDIGVPLQNTVSDATSYSWYKVVSGVDIDVARNTGYLAEETGRYKLLVIDRNGCESEDEVEVTINHIPEFTISDAIVCPGVTHRFDGPVNPSYSYVWSNGSGDSYLETAQPGTYNLKVTDNATNCVAEDNAVLSNFTPVAFDLGPDLSVCAQSNLTIPSTSGFNNFVWKFNDGANPVSLLPGQNPEYEYRIINAQTTQSGTYLAEASDVNGCAVADQVDVKVIDIDIPALQLSKYLCQGETIDISADAGYNAYSWSKVGLGSIAGTDNQPSIQVSDGGVYSVEVELYGCRKSNSITLTRYDLPSVELPQDFAICPGADAVLSVANYLKGCPENEFQYLYWNDASSQRYASWQNAKYNLSSPGQYSVTVVDTLGCMATDNIIITENVVSPLTLPETLTSCDNTGQLLTTTEVNYRNYAWYKLNNTGEQLLAEDGDCQVMEAGSYKLQMTDDNGCEKSDTVVVKLNPSPNVDLGDDRWLCEREFLVITPGNNYTSYRWNNNDALNSNELRVSSSGKYKVEVSNTYGCTAADSIEVFVNLAPVFDLGPDMMVCPGITYPLNGPAGNYSYLWSTGQKSQSIEGELGKYVLQITDVNGCTNEDSIRISHYKAVVVDLGDDEMICPVEGSVSIDAGDGFSSYLWHNGDISQYITADIADTVNFVSVTDVNNCHSFDTKMVKYLPEPELELLSDTSICSVDSCLLGADWTYTDILWSTGATSHEIWVTEPGEYWLKASDGCFWLADTMQMVVNPTPVVARLDTSIYAQVVLYPEGGTQPYKFTVNNGYFQDENVFSDLENGEHIFTIEDVNGCLAEDTVVIYDNIDIDIPDFFTPNGDGYNETWIIEGLDRLPDSEIRIYDRYGKLLIKYKASEPGWDGKYLGKAVRSDDYWYVIELNPTNKIIKGHVTLKR